MSDGGFYRACDLTDCYHLSIVQGYNEYGSEFPSKGIETYTIFIHIYKRINFSFVIICFFQLEVIS